MLNIAWLMGSFIAAYLLGSIPFGLILTRMAGLADIRTMGSGNIGATNVMRTGHKGLGIMTLLLDGGKGAVAVLAAKHMSDSDWVQFAGFFAIIGHIFPVWLRFKGGKGVATALGVLFALDWALAGCVCIVWLLAFAFMRVSSVAALLSIGYSAILSYLISSEVSPLFCLVISVLIVYTHRKNIQRLLEGTEHHFSEKKS